MTRRRRLIRSRRALALRPATRPVETAHEGVVPSLDHTSDVVLSFEQESEAVRQEMRRGLGDYPSAASAARLGRHSPERLERIRALRARATADGAVLPDLREHRP